MTVSLWQQREPAPEYIETAVAIIGGGISGLSAAIECESRGVPCVVIEEEYPASKASGRNAGYLMRGAAENYAVAIQDLGRERARFLWRWTEDNLKGLRALGIDSVLSFENRPSCLAATLDDEADQLERSASLLREDGFDVGLIRSGDGAPDDAVWRSGHASIGLLNPHDAVCSPAELVEMLRNSLSTSRVITHAPVYGIETGHRGIRVRGRGVDIRAGHVLVCTNAYASELVPELCDVVVANRGQMLSFRPEDPGLAELAYAYYLNHGSEYMRAGAPGEIIFGGARKADELGERTDRDAISDAVQDKLEQWIRELVTDRYEVTARWSGIMGFSPDGMPIVGSTSLGERVWFCGGLTGHGMSMGHATARRAIGCMLEGDANPFELSPEGSRKQL
ncbi:MAG: NAD(P)/FAD-dependent oxidoreductase [Phycisphaerales bacterium]